MKAEIPEEHRHLLKNRRYVVSSVHNPYSSDEKNFLERYADWLDALATGVLTPITAEQERFVAVVRGELPAEREHEKLWLRYKDQLDVEHAQFTKLGIPNGPHQCHGHSGGDYYDLLSHCEACNAPIHLCRCYDL